MRFRDGSARAALTLALAFAPALHSTQAKAQPAMQKQANIAYGTLPDQVLDLYPAPGTGPHRLVVFVHGGGWTRGNKSGGQRIAPALNGAGYTVASVEYRHVPEVSPAAAVKDAAAGIAYLLKNAAHFDIDPAHFGVLGHSSGAHMVALLGTDPQYLQAAGVDPRALAVVVTLDGVFDVTSNLTDYPTEGRFAVFGEDKRSWRQLSPVDLVDTMRIHPTFCLVHEDKVQRFIEQEAAFEHALKAHGEAVNATTAPGLSHMDLLREFSDPGEPMAPFVLSCLGRALPAR